MPWDRNEKTPILEDARALLGLEPLEDEPRQRTPAPAPRGPGPVPAPAPARRSPCPPAPPPEEEPPRRPRGRRGRAPRPAEPPAFLFVEKGPGAGQLVPLRQGTLVIGRGSASDLRLVHPSISRKHAAITREGGRFFIRDFGSQNGTFVNQLRCPQELELFPGDEESRWETR